MDMNQLLESLYQSEAAGTTLEKTAEATLMNALSNSGEVENPFLQYDLDTLTKMASELEQANAEVEVPEPAQSYFEEEAMDKSAGEQMAHACVHELTLIKEAMQNGLCRVCKTNHFDIEGSSICSQCLEG